MKEACDSFTIVNFGLGSVKLPCTRRKGHEGHHNTHIVWTDDTIENPEIRE